MTHKVFKSSIVVMVSFFFINSAANVSIKNADSIYKLANPIFHFAVENKQIKIKGKNTAIRIKVVAIIANVICLEPLYAATKGVSPFSILV